MASPYDLPHIDLSRRLQAAPFTSAASNPIGAGTPRSREEHGEKLRGELAASYRAFDAARREDPRLDPPQGAFLEVELKRGSRVEVVERKTSGIQPGAARLESNENRIVGLYVADESREIFADILREYQQGELTPGGKPQRKDFVEPIESIRAARLETFWTDDPSRLPPPGRQMWWEVWCVPAFEDELEQLIARLGARTGDREQRLYFPEHVVLAVLADRATIELMLFARLSIVELRRANDSPAFFLDDIDRDEQRDVCEELSERTEWPGMDVPAVCLLDTGVNRAHILIEPTLAEADMAAVKAEWGVADSPYGHGTGMAGLALFGDLAPHLAGVDVPSLSHRLESVKILPPDGFDPTEERLYGAYTKQAVALPETERPDRRRVFCLAVTNEERTGKRPTTWSAAIDQEAAGVTEVGERVPPRLFVVSAGNAPSEIATDRIADPDMLEIEDPAQAWNAHNGRRIHRSDQHPGTGIQGLFALRQGWGHQPLYADIDPVAPGQGAVQAGYRHGGGQPCGFARADGYVRRGFAGASVDRPEHRSASTGFVSRNERGHGAGCAPCRAADGRVSALLARDHTGLDDPRRAVDTVHEGMP